MATMKEIWKQFEEYMEKKHGKDWHKKIIVPTDLDQKKSEL